MKLTDLKNIMNIVDKEIRLDKMLVIRDVKVQFMTVTKVNGENTIWAVYENKCKAGSDSIEMQDRSKLTNRDALYESIDRNSEESFISINKFIINGQDFNVSSSSSGNVFFNNMASIMRLQHFGQMDLLPSFLDDTDISDICIASFTQRDGDACPEIECAKEIQMSAVVGFDHKSFLINTPLKVAFDNTHTGEYTFYNPLNSKDTKYYLQALELYDIWEDTRLNFEDDL